MRSLDQPKFRPTLRTDRHFNLSLQGRWKRWEDGKGASGLRRRSGRGPRKERRKASFLSRAGMMGKANRGLKGGIYQQNPLTIEHPDMALPCQPALEAVCRLTRLPNSIASMVLRCKWHARNVLILNRDQTIVHLANSTKINDLTQCLVNVLSKRYKDP